MHGTPVRSCRRMRAGEYAISRAGATGLVAGQGLHVLGLHAHAVFVAKQVLEEELDRIGDPPQVSDSFEGRQSGGSVTPVTDLQGVPGSRNCFVRSFLSVSPRLNFRQWGRSPRR